MKYEIECVDQFHTACDVPVRLTYNDPIIKKEEFELRSRLIIEEARETIKALESFNKVESADGLGDLTYVIAGTCGQLGARPKDVDAIEAAAELIFQESNTLTQIIHSKQEKLLKHRALRAYIVILGVAELFGIPFREVFNAIQDSNMDKVGDDGKVVKDAGGKVLKPTHWPDPQPWTPPTERIKEILRTFDEGHDGYELESKNEDSIK